MRFLLLLSLLALVSLSYQQTSNSTTEASTTTAAGGSSNTTAAESTTTTAATSTTLVPCTNPCTHAYKPVCGMYNGKKRTFENLCILRANRRCARKRGTLARLGIRYLYDGRC
ncbi:PREDICTED: uncharacterized protein LOC108374176 [Rhagoletis zephyria]|uniref:uncharacterized protein LOC108372580 n=1 Tax=Rhagoletis zephyria TaxID=28612 RepID=UPI000811373C|nr:PREDICTED: uncharacterized protein LOC108372580 [Rhagoletis zephyria]XP_017485637.1 PREDICTED: uncharacterized protein LOC108374176 [Rhagoletis zephyria]